MYSYPGPTSLFTGFEWVVVQSQHFLGFVPHGVSKSLCFLCHHPYFSQLATEAPTMSAPGHWGASPHPPPHQLPPTQWVPRATISVTSQSLCPSYLPQSWLSPHSSGTCTPVAQLCRGIATVSRMKSAASIELKTGPPKCTAQSPGLYNNDGILLCFSQSLKPFFTSLSVANCVSCFTEKIKPIPLENPQHPSSNLNPLSPPRASLLQQCRLGALLPQGPITSHCCGSLPLYPQISVFSPPSRAINMLFCCCYSVAQSCPTLGDPMDCSTPGFPVLHHLLAFAQPHVH